MKKEFVDDIYILLSAPFLYGLAYLLNVIQIVNFPIIYLFLSSFGMSLLSLFIIPRYINKSFESKDSRRIVLSLLISILAAAPFIIAFGGWFNYAG